MNISKFIKSNLYSSSTKRFRLLLLFLIIASVLVYAKNNKPIVTVPFNKVGTYIVIKVKINNSNPLNLILDSGIRNTIITELMEGDKITLNYSDVKDLLGLGDGIRLEAYTSNFNTLQIKKLKIETKTVLVLTEDIFNLSKHTGTKINGLVGLDFFEDYVVEVNYSRNRLVFYNPDKFIEPKGYSKIPLIIEGKKMFIQLTVYDKNGNSQKVKMLIDTGAELNAWFQTYKKNSISLPEKKIRATIGQGLNGEIVGNIARLHQICLGEYCLNQPVVAFPDSACIVDIIANSERDGTIGSQLLSRFNYFIDYKNKNFYFKPNNTFNNKFVYNIAGIEVTQILPFISQTEVWKVWENSPAALAGLLPGDQIIEINGQKGFNLSINELKKIFETPSKTPVKLTVVRNNEELKFEIDMINNL